MLLVDLVAELLVRLVVQHVQVLGPMVEAAEVVPVVLLVRRLAVQLRVVLRPEEEVEE